MSEVRAIVARQPAGGGALISSLEDAARMAKYVADSKLFSCNNPAEALIKIVAGLEMGFPAIASMSDIHIIEGKPSVGAHLMAAAIRRSGKYDYEIREHSDDRCTIAFYQMKNGEMKEVGIVTTTLQQAKDNGWTVTQSGKEKLTWRTKPKNMLFARTISDGYKWYCPDLTGGMLIYDRDEIEPDAFAVTAPQRPPVIQDAEIETPQLGHIPTSDTSSGLTVNDDGSLRSELDEITETANRIDLLIRELGITPQQIKKKLDQAYGGVDSFRQLDYAGIKRFQQELLMARNKKFGTKPLPWEAK